MPGGENNQVAIPVLKDCAIWIQGPYPGQEVNYANRAKFVLLEVSDGAQRGAPYPEVASWAAREDVLEVLLEWGLEEQLEISQEAGR